MKQPFIEEEDFFKSTTLNEQGDLMKAKKVPVGTISKGYKKIADGKWVPVKKGKDGTKSDKKGGGQGGGGSENEKGLSTGDTVKIPRDLTTDPANRRGQTGKVVKIGDDLVVVKFPDGKKASYTSGVVEKEKTGGGKDSKVRRMYDSGDNMHLIAGKLKMNVVDVERAIKRTAQASSSTQPDFKKEKSVRGLNAEDAKTLDMANDRLRMNLKNQMNLKNAGKIDKKLNFKINKDKKVAAKIEAKRA